jgi:hypothetical protein
VSNEASVISVGGPWRLIAVELVGLPCRVDGIPHLYIGTPLKYARNEELATT